MKIKLEEIARKLKNLTDRTFSLCFAITNNDEKAILLLTDSFHKVLLDSDNLEKVSEKNVISAIYILGRRESTASIENFVSDEFHYLEYEEKVILFLDHRLDKSLIEISDILDMTLSEVGGYLHNARSQLLQERVSELVL